MDSIADLLVRIKSAIAMRKDNVEVPYSKMKEGIIKILAAEGFLGRFEIFSRASRKFLKINLKYTGNRKSVISGMRKVSTPGRRIYVGAERVPRVHSGYGTAIISTSRGLMTDSEAKASKIGGEVICYVW